MKQLTGVLLFIVIAFCSCKHQMTREEKLDAFEKEYPVRDSHGNRFKTIPKVYSSTYLTKGMSQYSYPDPSLLSISYSPLWAEGNPTGFIEVTMHSYTPFYEDTAKVYDKIDYIYTKNILKWKVKAHEWVKFEPVIWGDSLAPVTKVTTFAHYRLVPLVTPTITWNP